MIITFDKYDESIGGAGKLHPPLLVVDRCPPTHLSSLVPFCGKCLSLSITASRLFEFSLVAQAGNKSQRPKQELNSIPSL